MITFQKRLLVGVVVAVITIAVAVDSNAQDQNPGNPSILKAVQALQTSVNALANQLTNLTHQVNGLTGMGASLTC